MNAVILDVCNKLRVPSLEDAAGVCARNLLLKNKVDQFPVPLDKIGASLGVTRIKAADIPFDAVLNPLPNGSYSIQVSRWAKKGRFRFSVAHEFGHILLHQMVPATRRFETRSIFMPPGHYQEELFCDCFASKLLMPHDKVVSLSMNKSFSLRAISVLANVAGVSLSAAAVRLQDIYNVPSALNLIECNEYGDVCIGKTLMYPKKYAMPSPKEKCIFRKKSMICNYIRQGVSAFGWEWVPIGHSLWAKRFVEYVPWATNRNDTVGIMLSANVNFKEYEPQTICREASYED